VLLVDRFEGLEEDRAHREWLTTATQLRGGGTVAGAWTAGRRHCLGGCRGAQQQSDAQGGGSGARQWLEWADDNEPLVEGEAVGAG
jgi:hypothetical protein